MKKDKRNILGKRSSVTPFLGLAGNANLIKLSHNSGEVKVEISFWSRVFLCFIFFIFGPWITLTYIFDRAGCNPNIPVYIKICLCFFVAIGWVYFIRFAFFPRKIVINRYNGEVKLHKYPWSVKTISVYEISQLKVEEHEYRHSKSNKVTQNYILTLTLTDGSSLGLFITTNEEVVRDFDKLYTFKEIN